MAAFHLAVLVAVALSQQDMIGEAVVFTNVYFQSEKSTAVEPCCNNDGHV